ncbi:hypothetical protein ERX27_07550 [Macrococcus brunensis]|uniref:Uncharacterized protein n=1 Tax=Macrococcus brunensis TaxID=198483 RepID=A0A4R6BCY3_9STAP|nr:hypothetical protein [Macrococcus brunensis]TDL96701.1 hypothetical protein ERX27_07550 [Macrococcus brunensis]
MGRRKEDSPEPEYAFYDGDEFIDLGTKEQLQKKWGLAAKTLTYMAAPVARKRGLKRLLYRIEEDDE